MCVRVCVWFVSSMLASGSVYDCQQAIQRPVRLTEADWHGDVL